MSNAVDNLTEKEKEALRLLFVGHDAKSSAAQLGISVHTVNDRLRHARRKLRVSSSREAARMLGEAEGGAPQNHAHKAFGMADSSVPHDNADLNETRQTGSSRSVWLTGGMLIMSIAIAAVALTFIAGMNNGANSSAPSSSAPANSEEERSSVAQTADPATLERVQLFLERTDASDWQGSWELTGNYFQSQASAKEWEERVEPVREPLGAVQSRELVTVQRASSLPGAPEGEFQVLQFETYFEKGGRSIETVVMMQEAEGWQVNGYFIA